MSNEDSKQKRIDKERIDVKMKPEPTRMKRRRLEKLLLAWLDSRLNQSDKEYQEAHEQLCTIVTSVNHFTEPDKFFDFLQEQQQDKLFVIIAAHQAKEVIDKINHMAHLKGVYIIGGGKNLPGNWVKTGRKTKETHTEIKEICDALQKFIKQSNQDSIIPCFAETDEDGFIPDLNRLDSSFMYTKLFKDALLVMDHNEEELQCFATYCRTTDAGPVKILDEFTQDYQHNRAIWWYTRGCFIYQMLNKALRLLHADIIVSMGFFVCDVHKQIVQMYQQQLSRYSGHPFTVYRGQGLSLSDFKRLMKTTGGLMAFNSFLSTSKDRNVSLCFAQNSLTNSSIVGILFIITIDPKLDSIPFADIKENSYYREDEILFSMHAVFRIGRIKPISDSERLFEVQLVLTADSDKQLDQLTTHMSEQAQRYQGWHRIGCLLMEVGQLNEAPDMYRALFDKATGDFDKNLHEDQLVFLTQPASNYQVQYCEEMIEVKEKILPENHPLLPTSYKNMAAVYTNMGQYSKAISYYEKSLNVEQKILPENHSDFSQLYTNIGLLYKNMEEYSKALSFYERALEIQQKSLPATHPDLANSYKNIAGIYYNMGEYSKASSYYEKSLEIQQESLSDNHPDLANLYNDIAGVYDNMGEYSKALSYFEKSLNIQQKSLPANHPDLATSYNNVGLVYNNMGEYSKALSFYERALEIQQKSLPANHPDLANSYNNIAGIYYNMGEYSKALSFYERALEIQHKSLPANHPSLATSYNNIGAVYNNMGEYPKALSFYERVLEIQHKSLPANHPDLANSYNNIAGVYYKMEESSKTLSYYERALEIQHKSLPANHPSLATSYNNIGVVYKNIGEYSKALSFYERALEMQQKSLPANHPSLATSYNNIGLVYNNMKEYSKALSFYERALEIQQKSLPANHPSSATSYNNIGLVYKNMGEYSKALSFYERALEIQHKSLPANHPHLRSARENVETLKLTLSEK